MLSRDSANLDVAKFMSSATSKMLRYGDVIDAKSSGLETPKYPSKVSQKVSFIKALYQNY